MGEPKAFVSFGKRTLLEAVMEVAFEIAGKDGTWIVGPRQTYAAFGHSIEDHYKGCGPLGGIHAALGHTTAELNLVLAVDTPFLQPAFLRFLLQEAEKSGAVVTAPRANGEMQPLCAVYRKGFGAVAEQALREGRNKIEPLFAAVSTRVIEETEFASTPGMFENLNTPEDVERARGRLSASRGR